MRLFIKSLTISLTLLFQVNSAYSYPEMIRHGYAHCASCHFNPAGGSTLTPYGRSLSSEILSRWSYKGEERLFHAALSQSTSQWIQGEKESGFILGGDLRYVQVHQENASIRRRKSFLMQADLELGVKWKELLFISTYGQEKTAHGERYNFRKASLQASLNESTTLKAGRAQPNLGLMLNEHFLSSRSESGMGPLENRDLIELQVNLEKFGFVLGIEQSTFEKRKEASSEKGLYVQADYILDSYKIGIHYWNRNSDDFKRERWGTHALLGFNHKWALLSDIHFQHEKNKNTPSIWSLYSSQKLSYEPFKGIWFSIWNDYSQRDLKNNNSARLRVGPGFQFFPRPHFELQALWLKEVNKSSGLWGDYAMIVLHYYL